ncbi:hypothetical protein BDZ91DRAFT_853256 [Kalaharituber pfeilii]|nr:hypothetical protein BDZ91DRAFT_853256 [Kalaharituber pfeilii]
MVHKHHFLRWLTVHCRLENQLGSISGTVRTAKLLFLIWVVHRASTATALPVGAEEEPSVAKYEVNFQDNFSSSEGVRNSTFVADNTTEPLQYDFGGVGFFSKCESTYNRYLEESRESAKWAAGAASTLMALIPALLAFGPLKTCNIGLLSALDGPLGFIAAGFTFGLPVNQLSLTDHAMVVFQRKDHLEGSGSPPAHRYQMFRGNQVTQSSESGAPAEETPPTNTDDTVEQPANATLAPMAAARLPSSTYSLADNIMDVIQSQWEARGQRSRLAMALLTAGIIYIQLFLFLICILVSFNADYHLLFWLCPIASAHAIYWVLIGSFVLMGFARCFYELRHFQKTASVIYVNPLLVTEVNINSNTKLRLIGTPGERYTARWFSCLASLLRAKHDPPQTQRAKWRLRVTQAWFLFLQVIHYSRKPPAIVVLMLPSASATSSRSRMSLFVSGILTIFQCCWLFFLSFLFGTIIGNSVATTLVAVFVCSIAVAAARLLSIVASDELHRFFNLVLFYYDSPDERQQLEIMLRHMPGTSVHPEESTATEQSTPQRTAVTLPMGPQEHAIGSTSNIVDINELTPMDLSKILAVAKGAALGGMCLICVQLALLSFMTWNWQNDEQTLPELRVQRYKYSSPQVGQSFLEVFELSLYTTPSVLLAAISSMLHATGYRTLVEVPSTLAEAESSESD